MASSPILRVSSLAQPGRWKAELLGKESHQGRGGHVRFGMADTVPAGDAGIHFSPVAGSEDRQLGDGDEIACFQMGITFVSCIQLRTVKAQVFA